MIKSLNNYIKQQCIINPQSGKVILNEKDENGKIISNIQLKTKGKTIVLKFDSLDFCPYFDRTKVGVAKMCDYIVITEDSALFFELKSNRSNDWAQQIYNGMSLFSHIEKTLAWFKTSSIIRRRAVLLSNRGSRPTVKAGSYEINWAIHERGFEYSHISYTECLNLKNLIESA